MWARHRLVPAGNNGRLKYFARAFKPGENFLPTCLEFHTSREFAMRGGADNQHTRSFDSTAPLTGLATIRGGASSIVIMVRDAL